MYLIAYNNSLYSILYWYRRSIEILLVCCYIQCKCLLNIQPKNSLTVSLHQVQTWVVCVKMSLRW